MYCLMSSMGGWAPYVSRAGMFRSSMKNTKYLPSGGPNTPFRLQVIIELFNNSEVTKWRIIVVTYEYDYSKIQRVTQVVKSTTTISIQRNQLKENKSCP